MANSSSTNSSMTSTSHTLTALPTPIKSNFSTSDASTMATIPAALGPENRHAFIAPLHSLRVANLDFVKQTLDRDAGRLGDEQAGRLKELRKKRKRGEAAQDEEEVLRIRKVHTQGFEVGQIWEQASRVVDALRRDAQRAVEELAEHEMNSDDEAEPATDGEEMLSFEEEGTEAASEDEETDGKLEGLHGDDVEGSDAEIMDSEMDEEAFAEGGDEDDLEEPEEENEEESAQVFIEDPNGLNDGFFSIEEFNKQTEFLEQQDAAADPFTGEASDEEDIDWEADPMGLSVKPVSSSKRAMAMNVSDEEEEEDDEDGPTFGNVDLNAPEGDSDDGEEGDEMDEADDTAGDNTNNILYKDFFGPPARKVGKGENQALYLERQARKSKAAPPEDEEAEMERAVASVRRDLFDDESEQEESVDGLSEVEAGNPKSRKSAHERRQAKIGEEIRRLEAASVAKREWVLAGEARAADRPLNSLLEEDLDFERTGKPVPEITAEVSESIEEVIKRHILAQEFDEAIRRRGDASDASEKRRGMFELDDSKPQQSLAEIYEEEHVKHNNPDTYVSKADEKTRKEEAEIEALWRDISAKLDGLSSWSFKPKPAAPSLTVVSDVATVSMEDAQPATASGINGGESMLAPQEIYRAGKDKSNIEKGDVVPKSGIPVARQEMTREEKLRRRRREKERIRKRGGEELDQRAESRKTKQKRETIEGLKKGGVKIIGKKGITDVEGNKVRDTVAVNGAAGLKL